MEKGKEERATLGDKAAYLFLRSFIFVAGIVPRSWLYASMKGLTLLFYRLVKRRRQITIDNLQQAFPDMPEDEVALLSKTVFVELSQTIAEILLMLAEKFDVDEAVVNAESAAKALKALRERYPNGQIVMTAHFSNWELAAHFLSKHGHTMLAVGREGDNRLIDKKMTIPFRERYGNRSVYKKRAAIAIVKALKRGEIVGVLIDQKVNSSEGIKVKFFGRDVYTTSLIATMKKKLGVAVVPIFLPRIAKGKYELLIGEPVEVCGDVAEMTQAYNDVMEEVIRRYPAQWFWMHNRWKV